MGWDEEEEEGSRIYLIKNYTEYFGAIPEVLAASRVLMSWIHLIESGPREKDGGENVPRNAAFLSARWLQWRYMMLGLSPGSGQFWLSNPLVSLCLRPSLHWGPAGLL